MKSLSFKTFDMFLPVSFNNKGLGIILGTAGSGKSFLSAELIVARRLGNPKERILIVAAANQPADVLIRKVNDALRRAKGIGVEYQNILGTRVAARVYTDASEMSYFISLADRQYEQNSLQATGGLSKNPASRAASGIGGDNSDDNGAEGFDVLDDCDSESKGNGKRKSKAVRKREVLEEARRVMANYISEDNDRDVVLAETDLQGENHQLKFYGPLLEGNAIDLDHTSITPEMKTCTTAIEMAHALTRQAQPKFSGVRDKRFQADLSVST